MESKKDKVSRSLKLEADINERLVAVCKHLGVNPNAYLVNEIGKAISRDEVAYVIANHSKNSMNEMLDVLKSALEDKTEH
jgi:predicted DNA-binding protein